MEDIKGLLKYYMACKSNKKLPKIKTNIKDLKLIVEKEKLTKLDKENVYSIIIQYFISISKDREVMRELFGKLDTNLFINIDRIYRSIGGKNLMEHNLICETILQIMCDDLELIIGCILDYIE